jgi:hypothetical protein
MRNTRRPIKEGLSAYPYELLLMANYACEWEQNEVPVLLSPQGSSVEQPYFYSRRRPSKNSLYHALKPTWQLCSGI